MSNTVSDPTSSSRILLGAGESLRVKLTPMSKEDFEAKFPGSDYMAKWVTEESAKKTLEAENAQLSGGLRKLALASHSELYL